MDLEADRNVKCWERNAHSECVTEMQKRQKKEWGTDIQWLAPDVAFRQRGTFRCRRDSLSKWKDGWGTAQRFAAPRASVERAESSSPVPLVPASRESLQVLQVCIAFDKPCLQCLRLAKRVLHALAAVDFSRPIMGTQFAFAFVRRKWNRVKHWCRARVPPVLIVTGRKESFFGKEIHTTGIERWDHFFALRVEILSSDKKGNWDIREGPVYTFSSFYNFSLHITWSYFHICHEFPGKPTF